jgi:hypothetical protein
LRVGGKIGVAADGAVVLKCSGCRAVRLSAAAAVIAGRSASGPSFCPAASSGSYHWRSQLCQMNPGGSTGAIQLPAARDFEMPDRSQLRRPAQRESTDGTSRDPLVRWQSERMRLLGGAGIQLGFDSERCRSNRTECKPTVAAGRQRYAWKRWISRRPPLRERSREWNRRRQSWRTGFLAFNRSPFGPANGQTIGQTVYRSVSA